MMECVEFPYTDFPRQLWERELVWMKNVGVGCVALPAGPETTIRDVLTPIRTLGLKAWVLQALPELQGSLEPLMQAHGGPVSWVGRDSVPQPVVRLSALDPHALWKSRDALEHQAGTMLWTNVESTLTPEFHRGAISFTGEEQPSLSALRRETQLLNCWAPMMGQLGAEQPVLPVAGKLPGFISARQLVSTDSMAASAVNVVNRGKLPYRGELRVFYPPAKHWIALPALTVPAGDALWLPVNIPLAKSRLCRNCSAFGNDENIVYATAELTEVEYENGILALEFAAPVEGEVVLHLAKEPSGPLLAGGKPRAFDWDAATGRARLPIPAGKGAARRVRIGLALAAPDSSAFFGDTKVLLIGQPNRISTTYSSEDIAMRSRLRSPAFFHVRPVPKSPLEVEYEITVPAAALHGDHVELALEADGVQLGHTRLQLLRPASVRLREAVQRHFGTAAELSFLPALIPIDQKAGREVNVTIRNNAPEIRTFILEASGSGLEFSPARKEVVVAASSERDVTMRVFPDQAASGPHPAVLRLSGAPVNETDVQFVVIPREGSITYPVGALTVLETQKARAVFSGGTWLEFVWKDSERNVLPEGGVRMGTALPAELREGTLTLVGDLPDAGPAPGKQGDVSLSVSKPAPRKTVFTLSR